MSHVLASNGQTHLLSKTSFVNARYSCFFVNMLSFCSNPETLVDLRAVTKLNNGHYL